MPETEKLSETETLPGVHFFSASGARFSFPRSVIDDYFPWAVFQLKGTAQWKKSLLRPIIQSQF